MIDFKQKNINSWIAYSLSVAVVFLITGFYCFNLIQWMNFPNFGFGYRTATGIKTVGIVTEMGKKAGLHVGDQIKKLNGKTFSTIEERRKALNFVIGEKNIYIVERDGVELEIIIDNIPNGFKRTFVRSGFTFLSGVLYFGIGVLVFFMKPHSRSSWAFFLFAATFGVFLTYLYPLNIYQPMWVEKIAIFAYTFTPAVFIHLALCFPQDRRIIKNYPLVQIIPYLFSLILLFRIVSLTNSMLATPKFWLIITITYMAFGVLFFLGSCLQLRLTSTSDMVKLRSRMVLLGFAISSSLPLADFIFNAFFKVYLVANFNYYLLFFLVFPVFIGYSIVQHDLFEIDTIIKRTYGYVLTTGALGGIYGIFILISNFFFGQYEITRSRTFPVVFILTIVFLFNPIRNSVQRIIDRLFYRLEYDYRDTVRKISEAMRTLLNLDQVGKSIMDIIMGVLFVDSGCVLLLNKKQGMYECLTAIGEEKTFIQESEEKTRLLNLSSETPFLQKIIERKREITVYDIQEDPFFENLRESCQTIFNQLQAFLIVPMIYEDQLVGLISLGNKKSGKFYRREDVNLLNTLANQGALAIENSHMIEEVIEKERMEEELSIGRDLQMSMLPSECPTIEGFEIKAYSIPAMELGGDFYDFIKIGEDKTSMVIGDVTGKSVSGALVMSASRSIFRMLAEENLSVGDIMNRANRRTKKDIKSGMFVALLFAVLNAQEKRLCLCSAGQTQPVYVSAADGKANLVETAGDTFPLGILDDVDYQETRLNLAPGDKIIFYTDGIVEAMNDKKEMFGFERLLEVIQESGSMTADLLMNKIIDTVNAFAKGVAQHDDITIIVLGVKNR